MNDFRITFICIIAFSVITGISIAQDSEGILCTSDDLAASLATAQDSLTQAQIAVTNGDLQAALDFTRQVETQLRTAQSLCNGWNFEGDSTDALGPLELEEGVYILEYKVTVPESSFVFGALSIDFENLEKDELFFDGVLETYTESGEFDARKTVRLDGGRYLISVDASSIGMWSISLSKP
ncbi:MAG: hypothetical protein H6671_07625 [Anaerolineaceae bacterium]|nr:hypothetical protein [Anaerolineaceae bacterium]